VINNGPNRKGECVRMRPIAISWYAWKMPKQEA
jgi:hypothetical protein